MGFTRTAQRQPAPPASRYRVLMADVCIVSGGDRLRYPSYIGHKIFAGMAGHDYRFEAGPLLGLSNKYFFKVRSVLDVLPRYDWIVWLDDDAFITDFGRTTILTDLIAQAEAADNFLVIADGPTGEGGSWSKINSGVFLLRQDPRSRQLLNDVLVSDLSDVEAWWDPDAYGLFTGGDQDAILCSLARREQLETEVSIVSHRLMNARPWQYVDSLDEHFICHFPGMKSKRTAMHDFAKRFALTNEMIPESLRETYRRPVPQRRNLVKAARGQLSYQRQKLRLRNLPR